MDNILDFHTSYIELSESALRKNLKFIRKIIGKETVFTSVIKGNAYGHSIPVFVPLAEKCGVRNFAVYNASEALRTFKSMTRDSHIMIMGDISKPVIEWAIENDVSFYIFSRYLMKSTIEYAQKIGKPARIHLELETGMNRTGLQNSQLDAAIEMIKNNPQHVKVMGVCTHYAGAESIANYLRIQNQINLFHEQVQYLNQNGIAAQYLHTACSAAALNYSATIMDMVRIGIAQYGYWPSKETQMQYYIRNDFDSHPNKRDPLHRIISWKSRIMNIKDVKPGEFVGYGNFYLTTRHEKIASVPIGYYHGYSRNLSNRGYVLVEGRRASVVGYVNMNLMMIDVTDIPGAEIGDEVVLIGKQKRQEISIGSFSDMQKFLNYEVLVRLPSEIPRVVVD